MSQLAICKEGERTGSSIPDPLPENGLHHRFEEQAEVLTL